VFTSTDNFYELKDYRVTNLGFNYEFGKNKMFKRVSSLKYSKRKNIKVLPQDYAWKELH
jgi:hypothetical protein